MNDKRVTSNRILYAFLLAIILLLVAGVAHSHKDKPHADVDSSLVDANDVTSDSALIVMDSIHALIQEGYQNLQPLFQRACYDCHSNQTNYPWYYKLPFVKGLIDDDITEARKHLDMSKGFPFAGHGKPSEDLEAIRGVLKEGEMPPFKYKMLHWDAGFSNEEKDSVTTWINQSLGFIAAHSQTRVTNNDTDSVRDERGHEN